MIKNNLAEDTDMINETFKLYGIWYARGVFNGVYVEQSARTKKAAIAECNRVGQAYCN